MIAPYGGIDDPNQGKEVSKKVCSFCNLAIGLAESFIKLGTETFHASPNCFEKKLRRIGGTA